MTLGRSSRDTVYARAHQHVQRAVVSHQQVRDVPPDPRERIGGVPAVAVEAVDPPLHRSQRAAYVVIDASGDTLATVRMDQRAGGGLWQPLGTWTFPAGWNRVALQRQDDTSDVVVADAVRARRN